MICDDALSSAIDSRKFANEFCARRKADLEGLAYIPPVQESNDNGWNVVTSKSPAAVSSPNVSHGDGFEVVGKKKKGKKQGVYKVTLYY